MLDTLDAVDWAALRGCYRTAEEVPQFLRALLSPSADGREWAHDELLSAIWHQGTVYDVSAPVVPFLYELLEADGIPDKWPIADLLSTLADSHTSAEVDVGTPEETTQWRAVLAQDGKALSVEQTRESRRSGGRCVPASMSCTRTSAIRTPPFERPSPGRWGAFPRSRPGCYRTWRRPFRRSRTTTSVRSWKM